MTYKNANKTLLASLQSQLHGVVTVAIAWRRLDLVLKWRKHVTPGKSLIYVGRPTTRVGTGKKIAIIRRVDLGVFTLAPNL